MSNKEVLENLKNALKPLFEKIDTKEFFSLDVMITPKMITVFYWLSLFSAIVMGLVVIFDGSFFFGLFLIIGISIGSRIACELIIVIFRINQKMHDINKSLNAINSAEKKSFTDSENIIQTQD